MSETIKITDLPEFDVSEYLANEETIAAYLITVLEEDDPGLLAAALGSIAKAKGMTDIAQSSGLSRESLYKALRPGAQPRFDTINRVCHALGLKLSIEPARNA